MGPIPVFARKTTNRFLEKAISDMKKQSCEMIRSFARRLHQLRSNLNLWRIIRLLWSVSRKWTVVSAAFIVLETVCFFASLYALKLLVDAVAGQTNESVSHPGVLFYVIGTGVAGILYLLTRAFSAYVTEAQAAHVSEFLNDRIHDKTVSLDLSYYEDPAYFDTLKRTMEAGTLRPSQMVVSLANILKNCMTLLALASVLVTINWVLLPLLLVFVLPILLIRIRFSDVYEQWRIGKTHLERKSDYLSALITTEQPAREVRAFNLGGFFKDAYLGIRMQMLRERLSISKRRTYNELAATGLGAIGFFFCIGYIVLHSASGTGSVGNVTLFLVVFPQSFNLLQNVAAGVSSLYQNSIFINSIFDLLALRPQMPEPHVPVQLEETAPFTLELKNVGFAYPHSLKRSLDAVSMRLEPGKIVALAGANGAGKSSLIKLICRLYDPAEGAVLLNGRDIRSYASTAYRARIGVVFQDFMRYQATAEENIGYGDVARERSFKRIQQAASLAGCHDLITRLPDGYASMLGKQFEEGKELSQGEWQKLAVARSLYGNPSLLILDEATSALDARAEEQLLRDIRGTIGDRTVLVVSHRYSVTRHADYIYVLAGGRVVQSGTNEDLIRTKGEYARLFSDQIQPETVYT